MLAHSSREFSSLLQTRPGREEIVAVTLRPPGRIGEQEAEGGGHQGFLSHCSWWDSAAHVQVGLLF